MTCPPWHDAKNIISKKPLIHNRINDSAMQGIDKERNDTK